jgi:hypothetical protein
MFQRRVRHPVRPELLLISGPGRLLAEPRVVLFLSIALAVIEIALAISQLRGTVAFARVGRLRGSLGSAFGFTAHGTATWRSQHRAWCAVCDGRVIRMPRSCR